VGVGAKDQVIRNNEERIKKDLHKNWGKVEKELQAW
jgi:hypothetical protein